MAFCLLLFFFSSRRRHTRFSRDWSSDVCSSDLVEIIAPAHTEAVAGGDKRTVFNVIDELIYRQDVGVPVAHPLGNIRSEERRVGKESGSRWGQPWSKKNQRCAGRETQT